MMKVIDQRTLIFSFLVLLGLQVPLPTLAGTTLPYFGPDQKNCQIKSPAGDLARYDAGFIPSENCEYIYVLPPKSGVIEFRKPQFETIVNSTCEWIKSEKERILKDDSGSQTGLSPAEVIRRKTAELRNFEKEVNRITSDPAAVAAGAAYFDWNALIRAYREANPATKASFVAMPVQIGALSVSRHKKEGGFTVTQNNLVSELIVSGVRFPEETATDADDATGLPLYSSLFGNQNTIMGQSAGLLMNFNLTGACTLYENRIGLEKMLSGSYTYVYPVQTKSLSRVEFNQDILSSALNDFSKRHVGTEFYLDEFINAIEASKAFEITLKEGSFSDPDLSSSLTDFKADLIAKAAEVLSASLVRQSKLAKVAATQITTEDQPETHCHQQNFLNPIRSCSELRFKINTTTVDWSKVAKEISENMNPPESATQSYKTFYVVGTSPLLSKDHSN